MPSLWLTLVVTLATSVTRVTSVTRCPERCSCGSGDELEYECSLPDAKLTITAAVLDYAKIDCEGGALTCAGFPSLPIGGNRTLTSLLIRDCSLPDPLECIARRLDATAVDRLILRNIHTPLEKKHVEGLGSEAVMMFNAGAQTSIPSDALGSLTSLHHFRLCNGVITLSPNAFSHSPLLTYLELSTDRIASLPANSFQGLGMLKTLNIWGNNISDISEDALTGLSSLEDLYLSSNRIKSLPPRLFAHTPSLKTVSITRNLISTVPSGLFQGLRQLEQVIISNEVPLTIEPLTFSNLTITALNLEQATITNLPPNMLVNTTNLVNLTIANNKLTHIPDSLFDGLTLLERLDLSYNKIGNVSNKVFIGLKMLKELKIDGNLIEELPERLFAGLRRLESLSISSNRLHYIHPDAIQGPSLLSLSLSHNSLSLSPPPSTPYANLEQYSPFNSLYQLKRLKLSHNKISTIFDDWRMVMVNLVELDLKYNRFQQLYPDDVKFLSSSVVVDLRYNNITTVMVSTGYRKSDNLDTNDTEDTKSIIRLENNPLDCDCRLYELAKRLRGARPLTSEPLFDLSETYCASPADLRGLKFPDVGLKDFICDVQCPCQCQIIPYSNSLNLDCFNDSSILDPYEFGLTHTVLRLREMPKNLDILPDYVTQLNLSNIGLKTAPRHVPKTLQLLDLTNNNLTEMPVKLFEQNLTLKLSGNMFLCDCNTVHDIALMNKFSDKILDWQNIKCKDNSFMWKIDVSKLCVVHRAAVLGGILAGIGLILAALAVLIHKYSVEIRIFLTNRGLLCCWMDEYDVTKKYDVFVSFSHDDESFVVDKLLPKLELNYKVCVHHRDWKVGDLIPAQIARSVEESRRTLIVLSRNFLASAWGMLEFRAAHVQAAKEKKIRVIILLLEDLNNAEIDAELKAYLSTNTYIKWEDQWFWEKLQYALPKRTRAKDVRNEKRDKMAVDNMMGGLQVTLTPDGKLVNAFKNI